MQHIIEIKFYCEREIRKDSLGGTNEKKAENHCPQLNSILAKYVLKLVTNI